jgi:4-carboxymuconolactone decarboxylase
MSALLDPAKRTATGIAMQEKVTAAPAPVAGTPVEASWRDFVFAEVWSRPGLDLRARYLIALAGAAGVGDRASVERYARGALAGGSLTLDELREAALHVSVYSGWSVGSLLDAAVTAAADALGLPSVERPPIRAEGWDPQVRYREGFENFKTHMLTPGPQPDTPYRAGGILNFVFGEMWSRPGLDQRSRRWLTLVGVANSAAVIPIASHVWAAMASGNATKEEMGEFVLQYAIHAGWPRASVKDGVVLEQADRVAKGLSFM